MTDEEATEALQVAMTVGATRMQVMLNTEQTGLGAGLEPTVAAATTTPAAPANAPPGPAAFTADEVVQQAGGG